MLIKIIAVKSQEAETKPGSDQKSQIGNFMSRNTAEEKLENLSGWTLRQGHQEQILLPHTLQCTSREED